MKTLSFPVCSGILYRRGNLQDEADVQDLKIPGIDCVVVNFYPFEKIATQEGVTRRDLIEQIDIGGPTLVRAAAKNAPDTLVLTSPDQYGAVIKELETTQEVSEKTALLYAKQAWERVADYDLAICNELSRETQPLRYGENPHQKASLTVHGDSPIAWPQGDEDNLTPNALSYNNILDFSSAYELVAHLVKLDSSRSSVVIVKHNNPCGVASVQTDQFDSAAEAQLAALERAWQGDAISAFGGVLCFSSELYPETIDWLESRFVELIGAPGLTEGALQEILKKRKKLKAVSIRDFQGLVQQTSVSIPGGELLQTTDRDLNEEFQSVSRISWPKKQLGITRFGVAVCRMLKSNAIALVRESEDGTWQLVGAGQGQPNRVEALKALAVPRAQKVLDEVGGQMEDCLMVSDAFFPFRDTIDEAARAGIRWIVQPGGSIRDQECVEACDEQGIAMVFTGKRHFRH